MSNVARSDTAVESRSIPVVDGVPVTMRTSAVAEWVGRLGDTEPDAYAALTPAERIEMVWPITVSAWAFSGQPCDESRLRRDVESFGRRRG